MLSTTPILYCKRAALHHAPDTRPVDPALLPVRNFHSLANLAEPRLLAQGAPTARLFHSQGPSNEVIRASVPFSCTSFHNCACAGPWRKGLVQEAQPHDLPDPTPFVREEGFPGNAETACIRHCIYCCTHYCKRVEQLASCYRQHTASVVNKNMFVEAFHLIIYIFITNETERLIYSWLHYL